jgi:hypothetical protein
VNNEFKRSMGGSGRGLFLKYLGIYQDSRFSGPSFERETSEIWHKY